MQEIRSKTATGRFQTAKRAVRTGLSLAAGLLALLGASSAWAANPAQLNLNITIQGIAAVTDLTAQTGATIGSINLTWTEPKSNGTTAPLTYDIRISSTGQISDNAQFDAAQPLSNFSPSPIPAPGAGGGQAGLVLTGLTPGGTFFFAIRQRDSTVPVPYIGMWLRSIPRNFNPFNFAVAKPLQSIPDSITDLTALEGSAEGDIDLAWTTPGHPFGTPAATFQVRYATFSVADLGGDTTTWFAVAASTVVPATGGPGTLNTLTLAGLFPANTFYFAAKTVDAFGGVSLIDTRTAFIITQPRSRPKNLAPATPAGLTATAGLSRVSLAWTDLTALEKGLDFAFYRLYRSTDALGPFAAVTTTTATSYLDIPLTAFTTFFFKISAQDFAGLESPLSAVVSTMPFTLVPMEPFGVKVVPAANSVSFNWGHTTRFADGTLFADTANPVPDELLGYRIFRSTAICSPNFVEISTLPVGVTTFTDSTLGSEFFYRILSFNTLGNSTHTMVVSSFGDQSFFVEDCVSRYVIDPGLMPMLRAETNGLGKDIRLERRLRPEDVGGFIIRAAEWVPRLDGVNEIKDFHFPAPARVVVQYLVDTQGAPVPSQAVSGVQPAAAGPEAGVAAQSPKDLSLYWHNGADFKKMYGKVDTLSRTVTVASPNVGRWQVRTLKRATGVVFDLSNISSRVITPNDDGRNDLLIFTYDPGPANVQATGKIYDLRGAVVASMNVGFAPNTLVWNGKMGGKPATSGVYVYEIKGDGKTFTGTIVVAR